MSFKRRDIKYCVQVEPRRIKSTPAAEGYERPSSTDLIVFRDLKVIELYWNYSNWNNILFFNEIFNHTIEDGV